MLIKVSIQLEDVTILNTYLTKEPNIYIYIYEKYEAKIERIEGRNVSTIKSL